MAGQKPRQGWIYFINPYKVSLRCKLRHTHIYELNELGEVECKNTSCTLKINSSRVFRGEHPHVIWTSDKLQDESNYIREHPTFAKISNGKLTIEVSTTEL